MKFPSSPLGISLGAGAATVALALVMRGGPEGGAGASTWLGVASAAAAPVGEPQRLPVSPLSIVTAGGKKLDFSVEVARTGEEQATGMMYRTELAEDAGMLFVFPRPRKAAFWMLNTYIPLDLIFIRKGGIIESIRPNAEPMSMDLLESRGSVIAVLEIAGGLSARLGLAPGDRVLHADLP